MKKIFKKINQPIGSLFMWFIISVCIFVLIYGGIIGATGGSVLIMVTLFVWPCFLCTRSLVDQILPWMASNMDGVRKNLEQFWTVNNRLDSSKREDNPLFWRILHSTLFVFWLILALVAFFCSPWSRSMVYGFSHSAFVIVKKMFSVGWAKASVWIWLITTVVFIAVAFWFLKSFSEPITSDALKNRGIVFAVFFVAHRILNYWLLCYTWSMIGASIIFWIVLAVFLVVYPMFLAPHVMKLLGKIFK
jgi:hypothetical protein